MKIKLPDYHLHTTLCNHAYGEMEDYVEHAINIGLEEIGFAEHMPVMPENIELKFRVNVSKKYIFGFSALFI
ncbi:unnamed protein product, partial [marine sediment metagenome]